MKAVVVAKPGGPEALEYIDVEKPRAGPGQVLVAARAFGVGQPDVLIRRGIYKWMPPLPANPGNDLTGIVEDVGLGIAGFRPGQKVLLSARDLPSRGGCYVEFFAAPADALHALPDHVAFEDAACLANYQVACALLQDCAGPRAVRRILVVGAAGGVGSALVQLAKGAGMQVIGTVSTPEKAAFAKSLGCDHTIFYLSEDVVARTLELTGGQGVDLVLDHVCGPRFTSYLNVLANWGTLVSYNAFSGLPEENLIGEMRNHLDRSPAVRCFSFHSYDHDREGRRALMTKVIAALASGTIKPAIAARFRLEDVRAAHALLDSGGGLGKIVMTP